MMVAECSDGCRETSEKAPELLNSGAFSWRISISSNALHSGIYSVFRHDRQDAELDDVQDQPAQLGR